MKIITRNNTGAIECIGEIDKTAIGAHSMNRSMIVLPYTGVLPDMFAGCERPRVCINVTASRGATLALVANRPEGKHKARTTIEATADEIEELLFSFFYEPSKAAGTYKTRFDCGLTPYWLGYWQACFSEWNSLRRYYQIGKLLNRLEPSELDKLLARAERVAAEAAS